MHLPSNALDFVETDLNNRTVFPAAGMAGAESRQEWDKSFDGSRRNRPGPLGGGIDAIEW
jgi:hypothetical protein